MSLKIKLESITIEVNIIELEHSFFLNIFSPFIYLKPYGKCFIVIFLLNVIVKHLPLPLSLYILSLFVMLLRLLSFSIIDLTPL